METQVEPKQENASSNVENASAGGSEHFRGHRQEGRGFRGGRGGGSRFSGGRGGYQTGGDQNSNQNSNEREHTDFRRRGRGRGGYRGGRDGGQGHGDNEDGGMEYRSRVPVDRILDKINAFQGPTHELPPIDMTEKKFNGRNRLYVGNLSNDITEEEFVELFKPFGETSEVFINKEKNFGFIKLDFHVNVEKAKRELDGHLLKGRNLKIRLAPNSATVKVKNLSPFVTNELLFYGFTPFGDIEKAHVIVDERGKPTGEGYIHFARKFSATIAIRKCQEGCFFLTSSLQPVVVEPFELVDDVDGFCDKHIQKKNPEFLKERDVPPRMALPGSFEYEYAQKFKAAYEMHQQKEESLKKELQLEIEKIGAQMEYAKYEHETEMLRNQLRAREMGIERQKRDWEMKERRAEEERLRQEELFKRQQTPMESRMLSSHDDMSRRQQETNLFIQAHNLDNLLEQQEQVYDQPNSYSTIDKVAVGAGSGPAVGEEDSKGGFISSYERQQPSRFDRGAGGHWVSENRRDDYQNQTKRRRF